MFSLQGTTRLVDGHLSNARRLGTLVRVRLRLRLSQSICPTVTIKLTTLRQMKKSCLEMMKFWYGIMFIPNCAQVLLLFLHIIT